MHEEPPAPDTQNIGFNLAAHVLAGGGGTPEKPALVIAAPDGACETMSHAALGRAALGIATGLERAGIRPGDRVLLRLGNTPEFPLAFLAAIAIGALPVPTSAMLTEPETARIIGEIAPALILRDEAVACPADPPCPVLGPEDLARFHALPPAPFHMGDPDRPAYIIYTSGTSGRPMAVIHAHRAILARRMMRGGWYGASSADRFLHAGAFNWTYTLGTGLMDPWSMGATAVIPAPGTAPADLPAIMAAQEITIFAAAPGIYRQMLRAHPAITAPALRHGLSAGEKLPALTRARWLDATGTALHEAYGMSECSTFISGSPARPAPEGTLGFPQPGRRVAVLGPDGRPLPAGEAGEIAVHRADPGLFLGYWRNEAETQARFRGEWFLTGDMGEFTSEGAVRYLGRNDDMLNAGGYRVSPLEIEQALQSHPEIGEAAAVELAVKADASVIAAFYTAPAPLDEAALRAYMGERLARYKQPRLYRHLPEIPKGANGKILRRALRETHEARHDSA